VIPRNPAKRVKGGGTGEGREGEGRKGRRGTEGRGIVQL